MFNTKQVFVAIAFMCGLCSCNNGGNRGNGDTSNDTPSIKVTNDSVVISTTSDKQYNLSINVQNEGVVYSQISKTTSYSLLDLARKCKDKNEVAFAAVNNRNTLSIKVKVGEDIDTLVNYTIEPYYAEESVFSISGQCAPLVSKFSNPSQSVALKKWLFRKKAHLEDEQVRTFTGLVNQLSRSKTIEYITNSTMPVLHSLSGLKYNVRSNIEGDHYVLFAARNTKEIDEFVEDVVANDFALCSNGSSGTMNCHRKGEGSGYLCVTLIAIMKDWSYKVQPLGLVAIDNSAPGQGNDDNVTSISFPDNIRVILPSNKPDIYGWASVSIANWDGNGLECNVTFVLRYNGDVKSITIQRRGDLCYYNKYLGYHFKQEDKVIKASEHESPYYFTYKMHFDDGDNVIPLIFEDNHGNKIESKIVQRAAFTRRNAPSINIDNNINIDNY